MKAPTLFPRATLLAAGVALASMAHAQVDRFEALANAPFKENRPTAEAVRTLSDELTFQRATQTYLWARLCCTTPCTEASPVNFGDDQARTSQVQNHQLARLQRRTQSAWLAPHLA
ncbi:hypothetical protein ACTSKR_01375 [Chitinibacteraceae bacterium HSL-7]